MGIAEMIVHGADGSRYPLLVGPGVLGDALSAFVAERGFARVAVITNRTLAPLFGEALAARLPGCCLISLPDGEQYKTLATVQAIYDELLAFGADRSSLIIALGGGVIGDLAGYAAATFMRGLPLVHAPTSLLAMVDSSIGGKVGVNLPQGKNLIGSFKDPLAVFADTSALESLPEIEYRCGLAEMVKAALVGDPPLLSDLVERDHRPLDDMITRAVQVKISIVEKDRLETGVRAYLNLGHTFAHALEQVSGYTWRHGEAVAVGLVAATRLSEQMEMCPHGLAGRIEQALAKLGLPVRYAGYRPDDLWHAMRHDKKWRDGLARFVLLEGIGQPVVRADVPYKIVMTILQGLRETDP